MTDQQGVRWPRETTGQLQALAGYPTAVCVVTGLDEEGRPHAFITSQFMAVSAQPPVIAMVPPAGSATWAQIAVTGRFCVNVLAADQEAMARRLVDASVDELHSVMTRPEQPDALPVLAGAVASFDCAVHDVTVVADREIVVGSVLRLGAIDAVPLVAARGGYGRFAAVSLVARDEDLLQPLNLVDSARAEMEAAAAELTGRVVAQTVIDQQIVFVASAGSLPDNRSKIAMTIGSRVPAIPPLASLFMAWEPPAVVETWLERVTSDARRAQARIRLAQVRERGYSAYVADEVSANVLRELGDLRFPASFEELTHEQIVKIENITVDPLDFGPEQVTEVEWLAVPIFGKDHRVSLVLGLEGLATPSGWAEFERRLARLEQAASNNMAITGGQVAIL
jgi:flavin reductase (DIM6/NTAB) family NADH-FMN oxidoreductase RutF/DNA-binding IclR family transcriptional regulator